MPPSLASSLGGVNRLKSNGDPEGDRWISTNHIGVATATVTKGNVGESVNALRKDAGV